MSFNGLCGCLLLNRIQNPVRAFFLDDEWSIVLLDFDADGGIFPGNGKLGCVSFLDGTDDSFKSLSCNATETYLYMYFT